MYCHDTSRQKICDQCGKAFSCNSSMRKHVDTEHSDFKPEPQQCKICNTWYRNVSGLRTHMKFMHENVGGEHRCQICNKVSTNARALRRHIYLNHECERKYKCHMCEKAFKREQDLREHISVHTGEALYTCPNCPMTFSSSANMYKHRQRLHKAEYAAHKQQPLALNIIKQAKSVPNTVRTKRRMMAEPRLTETVAPEIVVPPSAVLMNPQLVLAAQLPSETKLREHMHSHDPTKRQICDKCGKTFKNNYNMKKHEESEHSEVKPEPQQCTICNTWYRNVSGLKTHMKNMHDDVGHEHRCNICNKVSTTQRALKRHIYLNHKCEKKFKCNMCEKAFKRGQDLREHISVHTGEALYTCPNCPMTFSSSANMYKHRQRLHKAEYAAYKQQAMPPNIIKQAKSGSANKIRTKRRFTETSIGNSNTDLIVCSTDTDIGSEIVTSSSLINLPFLNATQFDPQ